MSFYLNAYTKYKHHTLARRRHSVLQSSPTSPGAATLGEELGEVLETSETEDQHQLQLQSNNPGSFTIPLEGTDNSQPSSSNDLGISEPSIDQRLSVITALERQFGRSNTEDAYNKNIFEYFEYAQYVRSRTPEAERFLVSRDNIADFVLFQAFREKRPTTKKYKEELRRLGCTYFDKREFAKVKAKLNAARSSTDATAAEPEKGVGKQHMAQVRAALKRLHKNQKASRTNSIPWEMVWTEDLENVCNLVNTRLPRGNHGVMGGSIEEIPLSTASTNNCIY